MTDKGPGRPKGTHVILCSCGRRVAGLLGRLIKCPDCGKRIKICTKEKSR